MTTWWMVYAALVGIPVAAASWLMAGSMRRHNLDERRVWLVGLLLSIGLPIGLLAWRLWAVRSGAPVAAFGMELPGLEVVPRPEASGQAMSLGTMVLLSWASVSLLMAGWLIVSLSALRRIRSAGARRTVRGRSVRVSAGAGPAVVGFLRPEILVPTWVLDLEGGDAEWILRHEEEHVRARDPLLLLLAHLARVVVPWNPAIWFLTSRLVRAIEIDCDRRVLRAHPDPLAYGHTLVRALARGPRPIRAAAAFSLHTYDLEERIATMTRAQSRFGPVGWISAAIALVLVASACGIPMPTNADDGADSPVAPEAPSAASPAPRFTPYTEPPAIQNRAEISESLEAEYPPLLRDAGIGGTARVWIFVGRDGSTREVRLDSTSGHRSLDEAALRVAEEVRFAPARNGDDPVDVWIAFPITFQVR